MCSSDLLKRGVSSTENLLTRYYRQKYRYYRPVDLTEPRSQPARARGGDHQRRHARTRQRGDVLRDVFGTPFYGELTYGGAATEWSSERREHR